MNYSISAMYIVINLPKIYACRADTHTSRIINITNTALINPLSIIDDRAKNENIYSIICPAARFVDSRIISVIGRII